jgi:hypothetical protein
MIVRERLALALHRSGDNSDPGWPEKGFGQMKYRAMVRAGREPISTPGIPTKTTPPTAGMRK